MKIKGFTLIELLAVIVILAIIALIAVPIILNIVEDSKRNAAYQSAQFYIEAVHQTIAKKQMNHILIEDREYTVNELKEFGVKTENSYPTDGILTIQRSKVVLVRDLKINGYTFKMGSDGKLKFDEVEKIKPVFNLSYITYNANTATINYSATDKDSGIESVKIYYGTTEEYGNEIEGTEENCAITGLTDNTKYYYQVLVTDGVGNILTYKNYFETTMPTAVTIATSNVSNPILTEYGVELTSTVTFTLPNEENVKYYYSNDNGKTWKEYTEAFEYSSAVVYAMSKNTTTGAATITTSTVSVSSGYLSANAYDMDDTTYTSIPASTPFPRIDIDSSMWNKTLAYTFYRNNMSGTYVYLHFYNSSDTKLSSLQTSGTNIKKTQNFTVPENSAYLKLETYYDQISQLYEISPANEPKLVSTHYYPQITSTGVKYGYDVVTATYYSTTTKKLYSLDDGQTWIDYTGPIKLSTGSSAKFKGIDSYGIDSRISTYTSALPTNALTTTAYDKNDTTYASIPASTPFPRIDIDSSMWNKTISYTFYRNGTNGNTVHLYFHDSTGKEIDCLETSGTYVKKTQNFTVPENSAYLELRTNYDQTSQLYEIDIVN